MCNNLYMREKALEELLCNRTREIESRRRAVLATSRRGSIRSVVARCGSFLVMLGTYLEKVERQEIPAKV